MSNRPSQADILVVSPDGFSKAWVDVTTNGVEIATPSQKLLVTEAAGFVFNGLPVASTFNLTAAAGNGTTDDSSVINSVISAANVVGAASGVPVTVDGGGKTYAVGSTIVHKPYVRLKNMKLFQLANANVDMLKTVNFDSLYNTNTNSDVGSFTALENVVVDGNKANGNTTGRGICNYGRKMHWYNVEVRNTGGDAIVSDWYHGGDEMEAEVVDFRIVSPGGNGLNWQGPHDSQFTNGTVEKATLAGIVEGPNIGASTFTAVHSWGNGTLNWDMQCGSVSHVNCQSDGVGSIAGIRIQNKQIQWRGGAIYGTGAQGEVLVQVGVGDGGTYSVLGCVFDTLWFNIGLGAVPLRYMDDANLSGGRNRFVGPIVASTNSRVVAGRGKTTVSGAQAGNVATLNVADTTNFPTSGSLYVASQGSGGSGISSITYTGKSSTTFTGCTGGNASMTIPDGAVIFQQGTAFTGSGGEWWWPEGPSDSLATFSSQVGSVSGTVFDARVKSLSGAHTFTSTSAPPLITGGLRRGKAAPVYSTSITPNAFLGDWQTITVTDGVAFTINAPTNPPDSSHTQTLAVEVLNSSGGALGVITWNAVFVFDLTQAWVNPANTKKRQATFSWNGSSWICISISNADY